MKLTPREKQVVGLLAEGLTDRQIAERLGVKKATISNHLQSIYRVVGIHDRNQVVAYFKEDEYFGA